jgi:hypothetical protein
MQDKMRQPLEHKNDHLDVTVDSSSANCGDQYKKEKTAGARCLSQLRKAGPFGKLKRLETLDPCRARKIPV